MKKKTHTNLLGEWYSKIIFVAKFVGGEKPTFLSALKSKTYELNAYRIKCLF